jgi:hypothetical protein
MRRASSGSWRHSRTSLLIDERYRLIQRSCAAVPSCPHMLRLQPDLLCFLGVSQANLIVSAEPR